MKLITRVKCMLKVEEWRFIKGTGKRHSISNLGNMRRERYTVRDRIGVMRVMPAKPLKPYQRTDRPGVYLKINVMGGKRKQMNLGYVVAEHFLYKPEGAKRVIWLDNDKTNNKVNNLAWELKRG